MTSAFPPGRRVVVTEFGETPAEAIAKFTRLEAQPAPDPATLGADEVLIGVKSAGVTYVDMLMTSGQYQHMPAPPYTPGLDYSGVVLATGRDVRDHRDGDRVIVDYLAAGPRSTGRYQRAAGFASYAVVPAAALVPIPGTLSFDEAACLLHAYETAYHCLIARANLRAGESVVIAGATGLTGLASVEVAKLLGAQVIALGRSDAKLAVTRRFGADHVINTSPESGRTGVRRFRDDIKAATGGRGADVIYDAVGGEVSQECMRATAFGARFLIVGWTSTPDVAKGKGERVTVKPNALPTNLMQMKQLSVLGCPTAIAVTMNPAIRPPRLAKVLEWATAGAIHPYVWRAYRMDDFEAAMNARWSSEAIGGCVLNP